MTIPRGTRLGPYVIDAPLGAGGMGEVFKAHDTRLDRTVAIKVLPAQFAADPARQERFEREARAVAALNHPNICDLHDIGETPNLWFGPERQESVRFLVMEYLEGQTLADRLVKGPLPTSEVLRYSIQLADALAHAHRFGVVHRDLKPANVMLTSSGAKLLDFGISKLQPSVDLVTLPTVVPGSAPLTADGVLLGTFPYMAPEHLAGRVTDARSDIFALGAMIFEMSTGRRAFNGTTAASLSGAILHIDPPAVSALQPLAPAALDRLVARCLAKDPDDRWQTARDVTLELKHIADGPLPPTAVRAARWNTGLLAVGILLAAAFVGLVFTLRDGSRPPADDSSVRIEFSAPDGVVLTDVEIGGHVSVSPNGARLVFVATGADDRQLLWMRSLDSLTAQPLGRTDGAAYPFWSPDSQFVGFFAQGKLKKIHASGGPPENLCDAGQPRGGTWNSEGTIVFSSGAGHELSRVSAAGGAVTRLPADPSNEERLWPYFLPDGVHFLYVARPQKPGIFGVSIYSADASRFVRDGVGVGFASGHLLTLVGSARGSEAGTLLAQPFDSTRLEITGAASPLAEQVAYRSGPARAAFSVSENGRLVYRTFKRRPTQLIWFDRRGADVGTLGRTISYRHPALSADGKTIAAERIDPETETPDLWLIDTARDVASRFTSDPALDFMPVWSPDSARIVFASARGTPPNLYQKAVGGDGREEMFVKGSFNNQPTDWSRDGRYIAYAILDPKTQWDLWLKPMFGPEAERKPIPFLQTSFNEHLAQFSPDGRWVAYFSDESGTNEVYVRAYPGAAAKRQVSSNGGTGPRWRADGKELFYLAADRTLMAVAVKSEPTFEASAPAALFKTRIGNPDGASFDTNYVVASDGQRFLMSTLVDQSNDSPATLVLNWPAALRRP